MSIIGAFELLSMLNFGVGSDKKLSQPSETAVTIELVPIQIKCA